MAPAPVPKQGRSALLREANAAQALRMPPLTLPLVLIFAGLVVAALAIGTLAAYLFLAGARVR